MMEFMVLGTTHKLNEMDQLPDTAPYILLIEDKKIKRMRLLKYLGLMTDDALNWGEHIHFIAKELLVILAC